MTSARPVPWLRDVVKSSLARSCVGPIRIDGLAGAELGERRPRARQRGLRCAVVTQMRPLLPVRLHSGTNAQILRRPYSVEAKRRARDAHSGHGQRTMAAPWGCSNAGGPLGASLCRATLPVHAFASFGVKRVGGRITVRPQCKGAESAGWKGPRWSKMAKMADGGDGRRLQPCIVAPRRRK
jgi:hypothetical protein